MSATARRGRPVSAAAARQPVGRWRRAGRRAAPDDGRCARAAVARFGPHALYPGEPVANLRRKFVPIWLLHRYQLEAAAKLVGGVDFAYALNGDGRERGARRRRPAAQRRALDALLDTLAPDALAVPPALAALSLGGLVGQPRPPGDDRDLPHRRRPGLRSLRRVRGRRRGDAQQSARPRAAQPARNPGSERRGPALARTTSSSG